MASLARTKDIVDTVADLRRRVRRLEVRKSPAGGGGSGLQYENYVVDPVVARAYPVALVAAGEIVGVRWVIPVGSIAVRFDHNGGLIYNAGTVGGSGSHFFDTPIATADGDTINPVVSSVFAGASVATMSFLVRS